MKDRQLTQSISQLSLKPGEGHFERLLSPIEET